MAALFLGTASIALVLGGCRSNGVKMSSVRIETQFQLQPVTTGNETVTLRITNGSIGPIAGAHVQLEADMNHPGMAPVFADAQEQGAGIYVAQLNFNMPGDWVVIEHARFANGDHIERQIDVRGVTP